MRVNLNNGWKLLEAPLDWGADCLARVRGTESGWMPCALPCDVRMPLQVAGRIKDVALADHCFEAEWVEKRSWWFFNTFLWDAAKGVGAEAIELTLESLDVHADVFLNGTHLGKHISAHYPFVRDVGEGLRPGANELAVRLTTGLETVSDADLAQVNWAVTHEEGNGCPERGDRRRAFLRKPQYTVGWDWGPKAPGCGIMKGAWIQTYQHTAIRGARLSLAGLRPDLASLRLELEIDQLHPYATRDADIAVRLSLDGQEAAAAGLKDALLTSGLSFLTLDIAVPRPHLWWPAGSGGQPLYTVDITVTCEGREEHWPAFQYGIRELRLDTGRTGEGKRAFQLVVNGVPVFCKGANWIPADIIYARVSDEKYVRLVEEARAANFNMLRVWGGGLYERDVFYEACDRAGILVWQDFMFGCASCPDHLDWFIREVEQEMDYQTRRLRNHACLALWCGNNENHWLFNPEDNPQWGLRFTRNRLYGLRTSNYTASAAVRRNCPDIPWWNSSPYGGALPNSDFVGDIHHWGACMMNKDMIKRIEPKEYDKVAARFVSEYGYPGPSRLESIQEYMDGHPLDRAGKVWGLHNNTFEKHTVNAGIEKHYLDGAAGLGLDDYLLYAGLCQMLMLGYSLEAIRFKDFCGGALFWMFSDTWGEVGWTIVDYALRRKIAYYGVKRAFAPIKLTLREVGGRVLLQGCNDTPEAVVFKARYGCLRFDGCKGDLEEKELSIPARSRVLLMDLPLPEYDHTKGSFAVVPEHPELEPAVLRVLDTRRQELPPAEVEVVSTQARGEDLLVTLQSAVYAHAVHIHEDLRCSDNYFDLLPGQQKTVLVEGAARQNLTWRAV